MFNMSKRGVKELRLRQRKKIEHLRKFCFELKLYKEERKATAAQETSNNFRKLEVTSTG